MRRPRPGRCGRRSSDRSSTSSAAQGIVPILGFLFFYKFGENLATALVRPFLIQKCYVPEDVGLATATIGLTCLITGTLFGGAATERFGLTRCLWIFGCDPGRRVPRPGPRRSPDARVALRGRDRRRGRPADVAPPRHVRRDRRRESLPGHGDGGLRRAPAPHDASASSRRRSTRSSRRIFALGRTVTGPIAGYFADALGWTPFFFVCTVASIPGLLLLQQFAPLGGREPQLDALERIEARPVSRTRFASIAVGAALVGFAAAVAVSALLVGAQGGTTPSRVRRRLRRRAPPHAFAGRGLRLGPPRRARRRGPRRRGGSGSVHGSAVRRPRAGGVTCGGSSASTLVAARRSRFSRTSRAACSAARRAGAPTSAPTASSRSRRSSTACSRSSTSRARPRPEALALGIAGADRPEDDAVLRAILRRLGFRDRVVVTNDARIAFVAGSPARVGLALVCGTGSIAWGQNARGEIGARRRLGVAPRRRGIRVLDRRARGARGAPGGRRPRRRRRGSSRR